MWVFGYGSLIWKVTFPVVERRPAYVRGWQRRFWQGSTDHRGVPGAPGRVVTLLPAADAICWGMAFRIAPAAREEVLRHLDHREKGGYTRARVPLFGRDDAPFAEALLYLATEENEEFLGPAPLPDLARQVVSSRGPSGENAEYVLELDRALRHLAVTDEHVQALAEEVRRLLDQRA